MVAVTFAELNLTPDLLNAIEIMGFEETSPIQKETIPAMLEGKDLIGQAQTGTGKTAAFAIPVIEKLDPDNKNIQALVLCPTRELVIQVTAEFNKLMRFKEGLVATAIYGGQPIERQLKALKQGTQIVIGTPGRTMDHLRRGSMKVQDVRFVVLDEADEMLDMGFREDIEIILKDTSVERQTVMFSATMPSEIIKLTKQYQKNPVHIDVTDKKKNAPKIQQFYYEVREKNKLELLVRLLDIKDIQLALVFCNTKSQVDQLVDQLKDRDYFADALHGDMSQNQRDKVMNGFRKGTVEILIATDVAGRGIDVNDIEAVFNYDLPRDDEDYIHRIGRTARAGKTGAAISFISSRGQLNQLKKIERLNGVLIEQAQVPAIQEIESAKISASLEKIQQTIKSTDLSFYISQIEALADEDTSAVEIAAALLKNSVEKVKTGYNKHINFENQIDQREPKSNSSNKRENRRKRFSGGFSRKRSEGERPEARSGKQKTDKKSYTKKGTGHYSKKQKSKGSYR
jgi:ATP-dependent RNA helicase DeaD